MNIHKTAALAIALFVGATAAVAPAAAHQSAPAITVQVASATDAISFWPTHCEEDMPCWNPATMGNHHGHVAKPVPAPHKAGQAHRATAVHTAPAVPAQGHTAPATPAITLPAPGCNGDGILTDSGQCMTAQAYDALTVKPTPAQAPTVKPTPVKTPAPAQIAKVATPAPILISVRATAPTQAQRPTGQGACSGQYLKFLEYKAAHPGTTVTASDSATLCK